MVRSDVDAIRGLSVPERLALVEEIWQSIADDPGAVPVTERQLAEARGRPAEHDRDPSTAIPWHQAEAELRKKG